MNLYGVFFGTKWAMTRNKRQALKYAKASRGYVGVIRNADGYGSPTAWDAPTFRVTMTMIADYSEVKHDA